MDDSPSAVSCHDLLYLMRNRYLDVLLIDLQLYNASSGSTENSTLSLATHRIIGAYALKQLASQLYGSPNRGSAVYSIVCNQGLRQLLGQLGCPFLIVYDKDGATGGTAQMFVSMLGEVEKVTGKKRFGGLRMARYLRGGLEKFRSLFPALCSPVPPRDMANATASDQSIDESHTTERLNYPDGPPEDSPSMIWNDLLFLSGIQATSKSAIVRHRFDHVVSLGEIPLAMDPPERGTELSVIESSNCAANAPTNTTALSSSDSTVRRSRSSAPQQPSYTLVRLASIDSGADDQNENNDGGTHEFVHYGYPVEDASHVPIHQLFDQTSHIIHQALVNGERVLVHCYGGVSRSSTIVMAYLIKYHYLTLAEAFANVFRRRPWVRPNEGFWQRLQQFEIEEHVVRPVRYRRLDPSSNSANAAASKRLQQFMLTRTATVDCKPSQLPSSPLFTVSVAANTVSSIKVPGGNSSSPDLPLIKRDNTSSESQSSQPVFTVQRVNVTAPIRRPNASGSSAPAAKAGDLRRSLLERLMSSPSPPSSSSPSSSAVPSAAPNLSSSLLTPTPDPEAGMRAQQQQPSGFSEMDSPNLQFFPPNSSFLRNKSRALSMLEDDSTAAAEGSLTYKVMSNTRFERVEDWLSICSILQQEQYFV